MALTETDAKVLASAFFEFFPEDKSDALLILKIFDFEYNAEKKELRNYNFKDFLMKDGEQDISLLFAPHPMKITHYDHECIENILNSGNTQNPVKNLSPLFDSIGWVLRNDGDINRIHFVGSSSYEIWNEPDISWDEDLDEKSCDWKSGTGWTDGWDLDKMLPIRNWNED